MAYVLGYWYADGSMEFSPHIRGKYIRVTSTDKDRIIAIKRLLKSGHRIIKEKNKKTGSRDIFFASAINDYLIN